MTSTLTPKPWVQFACVCEKALREPDNVASLIRIVDTYFLDKTQPLPAPLSAAAQWALPLTIAVSLKSGDVVGEHELALRLTQPDGQQKPIRKWPIRFEGGESGATLVMEFILGAPEFGLYWFEVLWAEELLVRIPLRVKPKAIEASHESSATESSQPVSRRIPSRR